MNFNEKNKLSGEELIKLMICGKLPKEYISEENLNALLSYELEQMGNDEYYDTNIICYCSDLIVRKYSDKNFNKRKKEAFKKFKQTIKNKEQK